jgi:hypothetical protein
MKKYFYERKREKEQLAASKDVEIDEVVYMMPVWIDGSQNSEKAKDFALRHLALLPLVLLCSV